MIQIDGKTVDLTNPQTWGNSIEIKPNGFIEQTKDGLTTHIEHQPSLTERLTALEGART